MQWPRSRQGPAHIAQRGSLERSLERYGMLRPPLYPSLLWLAARARIHPCAVTALLHAATLALDHPVTGEPLAFDSPLPDDLATVLATLR